MLLYLDNYMRVLKNPSFTPPQLWNIMTQWKLLRHSAFLDYNKQDIVYSNSGNMFPSELYLVEYKMTLWRVAWEWGHPVNLGIPM